MIAKTLNNNSCVICGIPLDAEHFDVSGFVGRGSAVDPFDTQTGGIKDFDVQLPGPIPGRGEQAVLASFQLHPQYCGALTYFSQYTDLYARDNTNILTPGFEWIITQNGKPVFPYTRLEMIVNPWGYNCLPVLVRLDENAKVEFVLRNRSISNLDGPKGYPIKAFAGRVMGRYWYNETFGGRNVK
jgi:hypothetical protein